MLPLESTFLIISKKEICTRTKSALPECGRRIIGGSSGLSYPRGMGTSGKLRNRPHGMCAGHRFQRTDRGDTQNNLTRSHSALGTQQHSKAFQKTRRSKAPRRPPRIRTPVTSLKYTGSWLQKRQWTKPTLKTKTRKWDHSWFEKTVEKPRSSASSSLLTRARRRRGRGTMEAAGSTQKTAHELERGGAREGPPARGAGAQRAAGVATKTRSPSAL